MLIINCRELSKKYDVLLPLMYLQIGISWYIFRYGFHPGRCMKALEVTDRDVGQALELLISECFDLSLKIGTSDEQER